MGIDTGLKLHRRIECDSQSIANTGLHLRGAFAIYRVEEQELYLEESPKLFHPVIVTRRLTHPVLPNATSPYILGQSSPPPPTSDVVSITFPITTQRWTLDVYPIGKEWG
jgi:hypothetical protein